MLVKSVAAIAALSFAANVVAEPMPYRPNLMKTSARDLFGVVRRQDAGYQPQQTVCGTGTTCAEACGAGYTTCASTDSQTHCFNPSAGELCCPDGSGNSCDAGYFCTADKQGETWCCPNGMDLVACAAAYSVTGGLVSQTPAATTTKASSTTTTAPTTTAASTSTDDDDEDEATTTAGSSFPNPSYASTTTSASYNATGSSTSKTPQPTTSKVAEGAGSVAAPAGALALLAAGLAALL